MPRPPRPPITETSVRRWNIGLLPNAGTSMVRLGSGQRSRTMQPWTLTQTLCRAFRSAHVCDLSMIADTDLGATAAAARSFSGTRSSPAQIICQATWSTKPSSSPSGSAIVNLRVPYSVVNSASITRTCPGRVRAGSSSAHRVTQPRWLRSVRAWNTERSAPAWRGVVQRKPERSSPRVSSVSRPNLGGGVAGQMCRYRRVSE